MLAPQPSVQSWAQIPLTVKQQPQLLYAPDKLSALLALYGVVYAMVPKWVKSLQVLYLYFFNAD